jgi:hypothetical protein
MLGFHNAFFQSIVTLLFHRTVKAHLAFWWLNPPKPHLAMLGISEAVATQKITL